MNHEKLLTANDVSEILQIDLPRVYELTRRKLLPVVVLGSRQYRFSRQSLEEFIQRGGNQQREADEK